MRFTTVVGLLHLLLATAPHYGHAEGGTWPPIGQLAGGVPRGVAVQGDYAYVAATAALTVIDISEPSQPQQVGYCDTPDGSESIAVQGNYAYVAAEEALTVIDISEPSQPQKVGSCDTPEGRGRGVAVAGDYAYVLVRGRLMVIDVSEPSQAHEVGYCDLPAWAGGFDLAVWGDHAYVAAGAMGALVVMSLADPVRPVTVNEYRASASGFGVTVSGARAYVVGDWGLRVISVADPADPVEMGGCYLMGSARAVAVSGDHAYVGCLESGLLKVVSVADPAQPEQVGFCYTAGRAQGVAVSGDYAYVAADFGGLRVVSAADPAEPQEVGFCNTPANAHGVCAEGDYAYVAAHFGGLHVVSAADPADPQEVGFCNVSGWGFDVALGGDYAYVASIRRIPPPDIRPWASVAPLQSDAGGLSVVSVADPADPHGVGFLEEERGGFHAVAASRDHVYVDDLRVISVASPTSPQEVAICEAADHVYDVAVVGDYAYLVEARVEDSQAGLRIISIADPLNPHQVGFCPTPESAGSVAVAGNHAYVGVLGGGLRVISVVDPADPQEVGYYETAVFARHDTYGVAVAVAGDYAYLAHPPEGLLVISITDPEAPQEVAYWETPGRPSDVAAGGGTVLLADYDWGLFVFPEYDSRPVFADVRDDRWAYSEIMACAMATIVSGYGDGLYHPGLAVTRDQMAVYIARALAGSDENVPDGPAEATFRDVPRNHWAFRYVEYCVANDIVRGLRSDSYGPSITVDRGQMAVFISRAVAGGDENVPDGPPAATFDDVPTDHWAYKYVEYCVDNAIVGGYNPTTYAPTVTVTRDQMAVYVARGFGLGG